jgi:hypothetical protein
MNQRYAIGFDLLLISSMNLKCNAIKCPLNDEEYTPYVHSDNA